MNRRDVLGWLCGAALPLNAIAQGKVYRIGVMVAAPASEVTHFHSAFVAGLREHGWIDGRNVALEWRSVDGKVERFPELAEEFVRRKVDVIVTGVNPSTVAATRATKTIPIVTAYSSSPIELGFAASLARPRGNVTGLTWNFNPEFFAKVLEMLKEALPGASRVAVLVDPTYPGVVEDLDQLDKGGAKLGIAIRRVEFLEVAELERAFGNLSAERVHAVMPFYGSRLYGNRVYVNTLAVKHRLPTFWAYREGPESGGLFSYGPNLKENWRRTGYYIDRILKGAKPGELAMEQPAKFELIINAKTSRALKLGIPRSLLARADQVIE